MTTAQQTRPAAATPSDDLEPFEPWGFTSICPTFPTWSPESPMPPSTSPPTAPPGTMMSTDGSPPTAENIGFAITIDRAMAIIEQLRQDGGS